MTCEAVEDTVTPTENLKSPVFAALMAQIMMPQQYDTIMQHALVSVNAKCPSRTVTIDK
jgi:hypothetical protein